MTAASGYKTIRSESTTLRRLWLALTAGTLVSFGEGMLSFLVLGSKRSVHVRQIPWTGLEPLPATLLAVSGTMKPTARKHRKAMISSVTNTHVCPAVFSAIAPPITGPIALIALHVANIGPSILPLSLTT